MREKQEQQIQTAFRLPKTLLTRADKLVERMSQPGMKLTRADVVRAALFRGIEQLEAERGKKR